MAIVTRSYRIRAYPNGAQRRLLDRWFGAEEARSGQRNRACLEQVRLS